MKFSHENDFNDSINVAAAKYNVDPAIIKGVIAQESNFISRAYRFEPYISPTTGKPRTWLGPNADFPQGGDASFGLMQLLSRTARLLGFKGVKEGLYDPATNIDLGTKYLSNLINSYTAKGKPLDNALSEYNGGSGSSFGGAPAFGPFTNQAYVNNVKGYISYFQSAGSDGEEYFSTGDVSPGDSIGSSSSSWDVPVTSAVGGGAALLAVAIGALFFLKKK
jgi:soluble lytic murein transglycosylase-like protein